MKVSSSVCFHSYEGVVNNLWEATLLLEAARIGIVPRVNRRLTDTERILCIKAGHIFIWEEEESGMMRWTDNFKWSASRVSGSFLLYTALESSSNPDDTLVKQSFFSVDSSGARMHLIAYSTRRYRLARTHRSISDDPLVNKLEGRSATSPPRSPLRPRIVSESHCFDLLRTASKSTQNQSRLLPSLAPHSSHPNRTPPTFNSHPEIPALVGLENSNTFTPTSGNNKASPTMIPPFEPRFSSITVIPDRINYYGASSSLSSPPISYTESSPSTSPRSPTVSSFSGTSYSGTTPSNLHSLLNDLEAARPLSDQSNFNQSPSFRSTTSFTSTRRLASHHLSPINTDANTTTSCIISGKLSPTYTSTSTSSSGRSRSSTPSAPNSNPFTSSPLPPLTPDDNSSRPGSPRRTIRKTPSFLYQPYSTSNSSTSTKSLRRTMSMSRIKLPSLPLLDLTSTTSSSDQGTGREGVNYFSLESLELERRRKRIETNALAFESQYHKLEGEGRTPEDVRVLNLLGKFSMVM